MDDDEIIRHQLAVLKLMSLKGGIFEFDYQGGRFIYYWRQNQSSKCIEHGHIQDLLAELTAQG